MLLLDEGLEDLLRAAGAHRGSVDEAYAALRDLGCQAQVRSYALSANGASVISIGARKSGTTGSSFASPSVANILTLMLLPLVLCRRCLITVLIFCVHVSFLPDFLVRSANGANTRWHRGN